MYQFLAVKTMTQPHLSWSETTFKVRQYGCTLSLLDRRGKGHDKKTSRTAQGLGTAGTDAYDGMTEALETFACLYKCSVVFVGPTAT